MYVTIKYVGEFDEEDNDFPGEQFYFDTQAEIDAFLFGLDTADYPYEIIQEDTEDGEDGIASQG